MLPDVIVVESEVVASVVEVIVLGAGTTTQ